MEYRKKSNYQLWSNVKNFDPDDILNELYTKGKIIKETSKTSSFHLGVYFIKKTNYHFIEGAFRHVLLSKRCRNAWNISNYLIKSGIHTPQPIAHFETLKFYLPYQHFFISEYLQENCNVEVFIKNNIYIKKNITIDNFFHTLKKLLILLWEKGIYHKDLSGKNLLTISGDNIYLIDLDSVCLISPFQIKYKIKNLIQIYDSFCDFVNEEILKDLIFTVLSNISINELKTIYSRIKRLQEQRRIKHIKNIKIY